MTAREILEQVRRKTINALIHQELPFEYLAQELERDFHVKRGDLFRAMLIYQRSNSDETNLCGLRFASFQLEPVAYDVGITITACDFIFKFRESSTKLTGALTFKTEVISRDMAAYLALKLETILKTLIENLQLGH